MRTVSTLARILFAATFLSFCALNGCTKKPSQEELTKLEDARSAAESAEKKLSELREERTQLEGSLQQKQTELNSEEQERDDLKKKMGK